MGTENRLPLGQRGASAGAGQPNEAIGLARATPPPPACRAATPPISRMGQLGQATKLVGTGAPAMPAGRPPTPTPAMVGLLFGFALRTL